VMDLVAIVMTAGATGNKTVRVTGTRIATAIVEAADSIAPTLRDSRRSTAARMAGLCKTVSANRTVGTEQKRRGR
jgi:hypothetical protein